MKKNLKVNWENNKLVSVPKFEGETIEQKMRRAMDNKEPIKDGAPLIYTERKEGVRPEFNPRTDRFEIAVDAMDKVTKSKLAKRSAKIVPINGVESTQGEGTGGSTE